MEPLISTEKLKDIGVYLLEGLTEDESCVMCNIRPEVLKEAKEKSESIRTFVQKKMVEFKHNHLKEISDKKNDKNSQWILEKLRPEQFGTIKKTSDTTINIVGAILREIQNDNSSGTLIPKTTENVLEERVIDITPVLNPHNVL